MLRRSAHQADELQVAVVEVAPMRLQRRRVVEQSATGAADELTRRPHLIPNRDRQRGGSGGERRE